MFDTILMTVAITTTVFYFYTTIARYQLLFTKIAMFIVIRKAQRQYR